MFRMLGTFLNALVAVAALCGRSSTCLAYRLESGNVVWTAVGGSLERSASEVRMKWNGNLSSPPWRICGNVLERWRTDFSGLVDVPRGVRYVAPYAFSECRRVTRVRLPDGVETIGERAFSGCSQLRDVLIPGTVTNIGRMAFSDCLSLTDIRLPPGVRSVPEGVFSRCLRLVDVEIPHGVTSIGDSAFLGCESLPLVFLPSGVVRIGDMAFSGCRGLRLFVGTEGVEDVGTGAFSGCSRLRWVSLPVSVRRMGNSAFSDCGRLEVVAFAGNAPEVGRFPSIFAGASTNAVVAVRRNSAGWDWSLGEWPYDRRAGRRRLVAYDGDVVVEMLEGRGLRFAK